MLGVLPLSLVPHPSGRDGGGIGGAGGRYGPIRRGGAGPTDGAGSGVGGSGRGDGGDGGVKAGGDDRRLGRVRVLGVDGTGVGYGGKTVGWSGLSTGGRDRRGPGGMEGKGRRASPWWRPRVVVTDALGSCRRSWAFGIQSARCIVGGRPWGNSGNGRRRSVGSGVAGPMFEL